MNWNQRLSQARIAKGINKSDFAKMLGVSAPTVTQWENGTIKALAGSNLLRVCEVLDISSTWLMSGEDLGGKPRVLSVPKDELRIVLSPDDDPGAYIQVRMVRLRLSAGIMGFRTEPDSEADSILNMPRRFVESNGYAPEKLVAIRVRGESMEPTLHEGDVIVLNTADTTPVDGVVFACNYEGEAVVKRMVRDAGMWWLASDNPDPRKFPRKSCGRNECMIVGRVVWRQGGKI